MATRKPKRRSNGEVDLSCFENQPNINMTIPWIYEIYKNMSSRSPKKRDDEEKQDDVDLSAFLSQPNINMTIPWIYEIYKTVKSGGTSGSGGDVELEWEDLTRNAGIDEEEG